MTCYITEKRLRKNFRFFTLQEAKGAQTRAKAKFIEEGEQKHQIFFFSFEKVHYNTKLMDRITTDDGEVIVNQHEIMKEQIKFFRQRYSKTTNFQERLANSFVNSAYIP
jgi:hypothetical protein